ncbi:MAG: peptide chain release factor N(5)-glutamine methyltransferase [Paludibacteraceae bacterium]|nr:peptide chain release factor N(5)-glutamine methyltransferase [Paludibacteraceae bacterium]
MNNAWITRIVESLDGLYPTREAKNIAYFALQRICGCSMTDLLMGKHDYLSEEQELQMEDILNRLKKKEPIQYILGEGEFHGLTFEVNSNVLIPRPETAELVDWICDDFFDKGGSFLDIGTGSGCIAITLKYLNAQFDANATDISPLALNTAMRNAKRLCADVSFIIDDILHPQTEFDPLDFIVSNPPYITEAEKSSMRENVLGYEPHSALFVEGDDPLLFYRAIADYGLTHLKNNGSLYFEINEQFGKEIQQMLEDYGYKEIVVREDMEGKDRMVRCKKR